MFWRPFAQVVVDLSPVQLRHALLGVEDRDNEGAFQMLVPALAQHADTLQLTTLLRARLSVLLR